MVGETMFPPPAPFFWWAAPPIARLASRPAKPAFGRDPTLRQPWKSGDPRAGEAGREVGW